MRKAIHPFLFAIVPTLLLYVYNIAEVSALDILFPMSVTLAGTLMLFFALRLTIRDYRNRNCGKDWKLYNTKKSRPILAKKINSEIL